MLLFNTSANTNAICLKLTVNAITQNCTNVYRNVNDQVYIYIYIYIYIYKNGPIQLNHPIFTCY